MAPYRLQILHDGKIERILSFDAPDDVGAQRWAAVQRYGKPAELWSSNRLISRYIARSVALSIDDRPQEA